MNPVAKLDSNTYLLSFDARLYSAAAIKKARWSVLTILIIALLDSEENIRVVLMLLDSTLGKVALTTSESMPHGSLLL